MKRRNLVCLILFTLLVFAFPCISNAGDKDAHDKILSYVLFGNEDYKKLLDKNSDTYIALTILENSMAIALDQYNESYEDELKYLEDNKVPGLPSSISEIDFKGNQHHRRYTHKGWNYPYEDDKGKWKIRKNILLESVNHVLKFQKISKIKRWTSKQITFSKECEAFAELIYYIHILHDCEHSKIDEGYTDIIKIAVAHPNSSNIDIFYDIINTLETLFKDNKNSSYNNFISDINRQADEARKFIKDTPESELKESEDTYSEYQNIATKLLETFSKKLPFLLKQHEKFNKVFYS